MSQIKEIDMNKYLVIKIEDLHKLPEEMQRQQSLINTMIRYNRIEAGKKEWPEHLVLNMDDMIDLEDFVDNQHVDLQYKNNRYKVKDIAVDLVNAILKAEEQGGYEE